MDADTLIVCLKTDDVYKNIPEDVETIFDTSNYEFDRPLPKEKIRKVVGLTKHKLGGKIMIKFVGLRAKTYNYFMDDGSEEKKSKRYKKVCHKKKN